MQRRSTSLRLSVAIVICVLGGMSLSSLSAQGTLSNQVLQLLTRVNSWTATNTFADLRVSNAAIPSTTTYRIYADMSGNLYFNGGLIAGAGGGVVPHNLLSTTHPDTLASAPVRGGIIYANATPAWAQLTKCASGSFVGANATDTTCSNDATSLVNLQGSAITGAIAAVSGVNLTNLNASALASGTVPLGRLSGITNTQIDPAAAIAYSKLSLTASLLNTDITPGTITNTAINAAAGITYAKLNLATSILFSDWATNSCSNTQVPQFNGTTWVCHTLASGDVSGGGTVTTVALSLPGIFTVTGSPVTTSGTLAATLASQTQNLVFVSPNGASGAPTFRALVNADFPTSGAVAGSYPFVTVNTQGIVTAGSASLASGTIVASTPWTYTQTWNNVAITFNGILENITDSNSNAASTLIDLQVAAGSKFKVDKAGNITAVGNTTLTGGLGVFATAPSATVGLKGALTANAQLMSSTQGAGEVSAANLFDIAATWNNAANTPTAFKLNITDTASNANSLLMDLQKAGTSQWKVTKSGIATLLGLANLNGGFTIPTATTATVTDTDALLVGGNKIPNTSTYTCTQLDVNSVSGDCVFIADRAYQVTAIKFVQRAQGGAGCVGDIEKLTGTTAPGGGTVLGTGSYNCNATGNNTVTTYTLTGTVGTLQLAAGDRLGIKLAGTLTALAGLTATIQMKGI